LARAALRFQTQRVEQCLIDQQGGLHRLI
jgi:hypothetical protein